MRRARLNSPHKLDNLEGFRSQGLGSPGRGQTGWKIYSHNTCHLGTHHRGALGTRSHGTWQIWGEEYELSNTIIYFTSFSQFISNSITSDPFCHFCCILSLSDWIYCLEWKRDRWRLCGRVTHIVWLTKERNTNRKKEMKIYL